MLALDSARGTSLPFLDFPLRLDRVANIAEHPVVVGVSLKFVPEPIVHTSRGDVDLVVHLELLDGLPTVMHLPFSAKALFAGDCTIELDVLVPGCIPRLLSFRRGRQSKCSGSHTSHDIPRAGGLHKDIGLNQVPPIKFSSDQAKLHAPSPPKS